ncbi:MAG TPA: alpha/beta fold hydrolase [Deltaproteobacteria bacterium]|nr:alpha/beta fold hydrolase [Deltaproteobacteria bacterium]
MDTKKAKWLIFVALVLILAGGVLAYCVQTAGNTIKIKDVRFVGSNGRINSALLYIPPDVNSKNPAPGIVATHGYINSRETQDGFAIEFARRGYVVLAVDQSGHGFSDPPAFAAGFGGLDSLKYLRTLDIVNPNNIGLEGHSMGGWASVIAAAANPAGYKSMVLASSSTGTYGAPEGTATFPRNVGLIYSKYDEFSRLMWGVDVPADIVKTEKLKKFFGTTEDIEVGKLYGSIEKGTARKLYQPNTIHPRVHFSKEGIGNAVEWMQMTLDGGKKIPPENQIWQYKELGNFMGAIGMILLLFPLGALLLQKNFFQELNEAAPEKKSLKGFGWWVGAALTVLIPLPLFIVAIASHGKGYQAASALWPQNITTTIMYWALFVAAVSLILFLLWHFIFNRKNATFVNYGVTWQDEGIAWKKVGKSFVLAGVIAFFAYLTVAFCGWAFTTDFRLWVFAIKPMTFLHFRIFVSYLIPFTVFFLVIGIILHGQLRRGKAGDLKFWQEMLINIFLMITGYILFLAFQYAPLFAGGALSIPDAALFFIVMFQFFPLFIIAALVSTYFYRKTGHVYTGAFLSAMLITWIVVASQATHFPL